VVLHDPVDHHVHTVLAVVVGVRVLLAHAPVRGPAGVPDAGARGPLRDRHAAALRLGVELLAQRAEVADRAHGLDAVVLDNRDPRGVIAAVFEPAEPREQQLAHGTRAHVADDSAHRPEDTSAVAGRPGAAAQPPSSASTWVTSRAQTSVASA